MTATISRPCPCCSTPSPAVQHWLSIVDDLTTTQALFRCPNPKCKAPALAKDLRAIRQPMVRREFVEVVG